jgi:lectin-like protein
MLKGFAVMALIGSSIVLAPGCDELFGLRRSVDAGAVGDVPIDLPDDVPARLDASIDAPQPSALCPASYGMIGTQPTKYRFIPQALTWPAAQALCAAEQVPNSTRYTHLVVITPDSERSQLNALHNVRTWIGVSDRVTELAYRWVTDEIILGTNPPAAGSPWASGEPKHARPTDDCVEMNVTADYAETDCGVTLPVWCECDEHPVVVTNF